MDAAAFLTGEISLGALENAQEYTAAFPVKVVSTSPGFELTNV